MRTLINQTKQTNCGLPHQKNWSVDSELKQSMQSSRARPHDADEVSQRAIIRARLHADYLQRPCHYERLAKRYGTSTRHLRRADPEMRDAYRKWVQELCLDTEVALTVTFRDFVEKLEGQSKRLACEKVLVHLINRLNRAAFGHGVRRRGQQLTVVTVIEGEASNKRLHAHLAIARPPRSDLDSWITRIVVEARRCHQIHREIEAKQITTAEWAQYLTKEGPDALVLSCTKKGNP